MKKAIIITLAVLVLWFVGYVYASSSKEEPKTLKQEYIQKKADHASKEFDVLEAKKALEARENEEEAARLDIIKTREQAFWSGFTK